MGSGAGRVQGAVLRPWKTTVRGNSFHTLLKLVQVGGLSSLRYCHPHGAMAEWHPALKARRYAPVVPTYSETVLGVLGTCGRSGWGVDPPPTAIQSARSIGMDSADIENPTLEAW